MRNFDKYLFAFLAGFMTPMSIIHFLEEDIASGVISALIVILSLFDVVYDITKG